MFQFPQFKLFSELRAHQNGDGSQGFAAAGFVGLGNAEKERGIIAPIRPHVKPNPDDIRGKIAGDAVDLILGGKCGGH